MWPAELDRFDSQIEAKVAQGLSAVQIYQDLRSAADFAASYETVKRRLRRAEPQVYCRQRFAPGQEGQIDFGEVGRLLVGGHCRRVYLFVLTPCFSRLAYYELVLDQRVPTFLGAIRRAFEFLGGVPARLEPDNLRSAVLIDPLGQRAYQESFFRFCRHYGTIPDCGAPRDAHRQGARRARHRLRQGNRLSGARVRRLGSGPLASRALAR